MSAQAEMGKGANAKERDARKDFAACIPLVAFGAFFITVPYLPPQLSLVGTGLTAGTNDCFVAMIAGVLAGLSCVVYGLCGKRAFSIPPAIVAGGSFGFVASLVVYAWVAPSGFPPQAASACAALAGAFAVVPGIAWGFLYARLPLLQSLACIAAALGLGSAVNAIFVIGLFETSPAMCVLMAALGVSYPAACAVRGFFGKPDKDGGEMGHASSQGAQEGVPFSIVELKASASVMPDDCERKEEGAESKRVSFLRSVDLCLGVFLLAFASSARCGAYESGAMPQMFQVEEAIALVFGALCVAVLLRFKKSIELSAVMDFYIPVAAAAFFAFSAFAVDTPMFGVGFFASHVLLAFIVCLAFSSLAALSGKGEVSPWALHAGAYAGMAACALLGLALHSLVGSEQVGAVLLVVASMYFVYIVLVALFRQRRLVERVALRDGEALQRSRADSVRDACDRLASEHGLTAREGEILPYLAAGHNSPYIAAKLVISEYTVRTHMRNMYRKFGVASKEELVGRIEDELQ